MLQTPCFSAFSFFLFKKNQKLIVSIALLLEGASPGSTSDSNSQRSFNELNRAIRREVTRLSERWSNLILQAERWQTKLDEVLPKIHTFQKSLEAVMQRLVEAERAQTALSNTSMARMNNGGTATESEILLFRNQLKVTTNGLFQAN